MLHDMIPEKVEEYVFLPYLQKLFAKCDAEHGYWTFLMELYPELTYEVGDANAGYINDPTSFIYNFLSREKGFQTYIDMSHFPCVDEFIFEKWVVLDDEYSEIDSGYHGQVIKQDRIPHDYPSDWDEPTVVGYSCAFEVATVFADPLEYLELTSRLEDEDFDLVKEYKAARAYMEELMAKQSTDSEDIFDLFE